MRPSRGCRLKVLVDDIGPQDVIRSKSHRQRRHRMQNIVDLSQHESSLPIANLISSKLRTPSSRSHNYLKSSSLAAKSIRSDVMPRGGSLLTVGNGPKLTKTGRVCKAKKGVKGAHSCECGKVGSPFVCFFCVTFGGSGLTLSLSCTSKLAVTLLHVFAPRFGLYACSLTSYRLTRERSIYVDTNKIMRNDCLAYCVARRFTEKTCSNAIWRLSSTSPVHVTRYNTRLIVNQQLFHPNFSSRFSDKRRPNLSTACASSSLCLFRPSIDDNTSQSGSNQSLP